MIFHDPSGASQFRRIRILWNAASMLIALACALPAHPAAAGRVQTIAGGIDIDRYLGSWYEIARLPLFFERVCKSDIVATYTPRADGAIGVHNACRDAKGGIESADGVAIVPDARQTARLKVRFAPAWLGFLPFVWADYWVLDVSPDYQWALVGEPSRRYLWILARQPSLPAATFDALRGEALAMGYSLDSLMVSGRIDTP